MTDKYKHLNDRRPNVPDILNIPVYMVANKHLDELSHYFKDIKNKYIDTDPDIASAASSICEKIALIINLGKNRISGEIMKAASDDNYLKAANDDNYLKAANDDNYSV